MSRVFADQGVKLVWLTTIPAALAAIPVASLTGGKDLSDFAVVGSSQFEQADSDKIDEKAYSDKGKVSNPTYKNCVGHLVAYRDWSGTAYTVSDPKALFANREIGVMIKRKGVPEDTAWAIGQEYEFFKLGADAVKTIQDADGSYERIDVSFDDKGDCGWGIVVA